MLAWGIIAVIATIVFLSSMFALFVSLSSVNTNQVKVLAGLMWFSAPIATVSGVIWFIYFVASFFG